MCHADRQGAGVSGFGMGYYETGDGGETFVHLSCPFGRIGRPVAQPPAPYHYGSSSPAAPWHHGTARRSVGVTFLINSFWISHPPMSQGVTSVGTNTF